MTKTHAKRDQSTLVARFGATPGFPYRAAIWDNERHLRFNPRTYNQRHWVVDYTDLELERSIENLRNAWYGVYTDKSGRTLRTTTTTDGESVEVYGLTRTAALDVSTTSGTTAGLFRDVALEDRKNATVRAAISFDVLRDQYGLCWPLVMARAGDTIRIRNLPASFIVSAFDLTTFTIGRTRYNAIEDRIAIEPEDPLPLLEVLLARRVEGLALE